MAKTATKRARSSGSGSNRRSRSTSSTKPYFLRRLTRHLRTDPFRLEVIEQAFAQYQRPNLHLAFERLLAAKGVEHELEGVLMAEDYESVTLAKLSREQTARRVYAGPVEYKDVEIA